MVINCTQENKFGALSCPQKKGNWCSTVFRRTELVHYCSQEKGTGALLIAGEGNWCFTVSRRKKLEHYCSQGDGHWCTNVLKEKETGVLLFSGEKTGALLF